MITIYLNGEQREIPSAINLVRLLELFSLPSRRIAVELNNNVVRRIDWPLSILRAGDKLEVVHFVGGG